MARSLKPPGKALSGSPRILEAVGHPPQPWSSEKDPQAQFDATKTMVTRKRPPSSPTCQTHQKIQKLKKKMFDFLTF